MSLLGALSLGRSSLAAQQAGLQVTGNNIANAGTEGYTRQTARLSPAGSTEISPGQFVGNGVRLAGIEREVSAAINSSLRDATSNQNSAETLDTLLGRIETTFGALDDKDLAGRMTEFFTSVSTLSQNPSSDAQRSVVIQKGVSLADYVQSLRSRLSAIRTEAQGQITAMVSQANALANTVARLNKEITVTEGGAGGANNLRDERDQALMKLAEMMDIRVIDQPNGTVNVLVGSMPLVDGVYSRGVSSEQAIDETTGLLTTTVTFANNGDEMLLTGGKLGTIISARDTYLTPALEAVDTIASGLISAVNGIHTQGQGLVGYSNVTGATQVTDPTAALNTGQLATGLFFPPENGTFKLYIKDTVSGLPVTRQIAVNLSGQGTQTTANSLAADITAAGGGVISAVVGTDGRLAITSNNQNVTFSFGEDTSGVLASLGINTFFTGTDAMTIAVNSLLTTNPALLATGRNNVLGSNDNSRALEQAGNAALGILGGKSVTEFYAQYIGELASRARNASDDVTAQTAIRDAVFAQQQAVSGVSLDEEAINLTKYQRAFQGTARYITVIDEMIQTVIGLIR